jgi:hypothetical protein
MGRTPWSAEINAYNPASGAFLGTLSTGSGPIVNSGLWAIGFRTAGPSVNTDAIYFDAGIDNQTEGLFGDITVVPEPGRLGLVLLGTGLIFLQAHMRRLN